jgi:hypothetical protein
MSHRDEIIMRTHKEFYTNIKNAMAKSQLNGTPIKSTSEFTRRLSESDLWEHIESDILRSNKRVELKMRMRFDGLI